MRTRDVKIALGGLALLALVSGPKAPPSPGVAPKAKPGTKSNTGPTPTSTGPGRQGDLISYYQDPSTGLILTKPVEAPDVQWGNSEIVPNKVSAFQAMVKRWGTLIDDAGIQYRVPSEQIQATMWSESSGNPNAVSKVGAMGLMQVMPFHFPKGTTTQQMLDPRTNVMRGVALLAQGRANGSRDLVQTASIYNAGPPSGPAYSNDQKPGLATRWGYAAQPGYIDSVVAAYNTAVKLGKTGALPTS